MHVSASLSAGKGQQHDACFHDRSHQSINRRRRPSEIAFKPSIVERTPISISVFIGSSTTTRHARLPRQREQKIAEEQSCKPTPSTLNAWRYHPLWRELHRSLRIHYLFLPCPAALPWDLGATVSSAKDEGILVRSNAADSA